MYYSSKSKKYFSLGLKVNCSSVFCCCISSSLISSASLKNKNRKYYTVLGSKRPLSRLFISSLTFRLDYFFGSKSLKTFIKSSVRDITLEFDNIEVERSKYGNEVNV